MQTFGNIVYFPVTALATGDNIVAAAIAGKCFVLTHYVLAITGSDTLTFMSDVGGSAVALSGLMPVAAPGIGASNNERGHVVTAAGKSLNFKIGGSITKCEGFISGYYVNA